MAVEWTKETTSREWAQIATCACGATKRRTIIYTRKRSWRSDMNKAVSDHTTSNALPQNCTCGARLRFKDIIGRERPNTLCDARCMSSTGHVCECSCGGKNHGINFN